MLKHIALVTDGIHPFVIGGMQKHSYCLAKYFAQSGIRVSLYHPSMMGQDLLSVFSKEEQAFIDLILVPFPKRGRLPGHYIRESYEYSRRVYELLRQNLKLDFIYVKGFCGWKLLEEKKAGQTFPPIGLNFHGYEMFQPSFGLKSKLEQILLLRGAVKFNMEQSDFLFSYGGGITEIIKNLGFSSKKIIELPSGIEDSWIEDFSSVPHTPIRFIFVGRNERRKGIKELNSVLRTLIKTAEFEIKFVGPIPANEQLKSEKIQYLGEIRDSEKMKALLRESDVMLCPSHSEGMPNVLLEGMSCGLAMIASNVGAVNCLVDSKNGWLLEPGSLSELEAAMMSAIQKSESDLQAMKIQSIQKVKQNFRWSDIVQQSIQKINSVLSISVNS